MLEKLRFIYLFIWNNVPGRNFKSVESLNGELMSSIIHVLPLIFLYLPVWIRIRIRNTDPDPQGSWMRIKFGSGSTTMLTIPGFLEQVQYISIFWASPISWAPPSCPRVPSWADARVSCRWGRTPAPPPGSWTCPGPTSTQSCHRFGLKCTVG